MLGDNSGHWETMSMRTVESAPSKSRIRSAVEKPCVTNKLNTSDIVGAQASTIRERKERMLNSAHRNLHEPSDILGAQPQKLIPGVVCRPNDRILKNDDIEWSKPSCSQMRTKRILNPLNPEYQYPSAILRPVTPPKLIRPSNVTHDINQKEQRMDFATRNHIDYSDVNGSKPNHVLKKIPFNKLNVQDINNDMIFKSKRVTNPLSPRYHYNVPPHTKKSSSEPSTWKIGDIKDGHPRKLPETRKDRPLFSLRIEDIDNIKQPGGHHVPNTFPIKRRQYRQTNDIKDIAGTQSSMKFNTFHQSKRVTNPLNPNY